jgi:L-ascorbate oxidase
MKSAIGFKCGVFLLTLVCAPLPYKTDALAQTSSKDRCAAVIAGDEGGSGEYRPMLSFRLRGHELPRKLAVDMTMLLSRQQSGDGTNEKFKLPIEIGDYAVYNAPFLRLIPQGGVEAYVRIPGDKLTEGVDCVIPVSKFQDAEFVSRWGYAAARLEAEQGDTLDFTVRSKLSYLDRAVANRPGPAPNGGVPCQSTNIHTHGMLVKPTQGSASTPFGDYVLTVTGPEAERGKPDECGADVHRGHGSVAYDMHYRIAIPGRPNDPGNADPTVSGKHPSGLYWFHPHPHGYSAQQLRGGTTGLLTVGDMRNYAPDAEAVERAGLARFMLLKDLQLVNVRPSTSQNAKKTADFSYDYHASLDSGDYCGPKDRPDYFLAGYCNMQVGIGSVDESKVWMFTVNGIRYPTIRAEPKGGVPLVEVWRIANASSNASYRLRIVSNKNPAAVPASRHEGACQNGPDDRSLMFQVLSKDGVSIAADAKNAGCIDEILLMPAARVEIKISAPVTGGEYDLVTEGYGSGGDHWPRMQLAHIVWRGTASLSPQAAPAAQKSDAWSVTGSPPSISSPEQRERLLSAPLVKRVGGTPVDKFSNPCVWANDWERAILLVKKQAGSSNEEFGIISGVRPGAETMAPLPGPEQPSERAVFRNQDQKRLYRLGDFAPLFALSLPYSPSFGSPMDFGYVCAHLHPEPETWVVENWTDEDHNFHIHQSKFSALPAPPKLAPTAYFNFPGCTKPDAPDGCGNEEVGEIRRFYLAARASNYHGANIYNDTVPVPRGINLGMDANGPFGCNMAPGARGSLSDRNATGADLLCNPGRIAISIKFTRLEQVGDYVFHCHILEHEDKGMMALLHVDRASEQAQGEMPLRTTPHSHMH